MFYTKDLYLDAVTDEGGQALYKLYNDYEVQVGIEGTADFVIPRTYKLLEEVITGDGLRFLIRQRIDDAVVGYCSLTVNWITHTAHPMLFIGKAFRDKGYGKQLMALLMYVAFQEVNCRKIAITVYSFNERAMHLYQSVGFKEEGRVLEECYRNGQYWDVVYMGLFRTNWQEYHRTMVRAGTRSHNSQKEPVWRVYLMYKDSNNEIAYVRCDEEPSDEIVAQALELNRPMGATAAFKRLDAADFVPELYTKNENQ